MKLYYFQSLFYYIQHTTKYIFISNVYRTMLSYRSGVDGIFKVNRQNKGILKLIA